MYKPSEILLVARKWPRRGAYTSVERFLDYFEDYPKLTLTNKEVRFYRLCKWVASFAHPQNYTSQSFYLEALVVFYCIKRMFHQPIRIVHYFYGDHDYFFTGPLLAFLHIKVNATFYFSPKEYTDKYRNLNHLKHLSIIFTTGPEQHELFNNNNLSKKTRLLPLGVDTQFFTPAGPGTKKNLVFTILQSGKNRRDFPLLYRVLKKLADQKYDICVKMIGCDIHESQFSDLEFCQFYGHLDDQAYRNHYQSADLMVLALEDGATSNSLMEALSCGLPVLATDQPNFRYFCGPGVVLCPPPYEKNLYLQLVSFYQNPEQLLPLSQAARAHSLQFDWSQIQKGYKQEWDQLARTSTHE